jgi:hypothetical protein
MLKHVLIDGVKDIYYQQWLANAPAKLSASMSALRPSM